MFSHFHRFETLYNLEFPMRLKLGRHEEDTYLYFASSPLVFNTPKRTNDIDALLHVINTAEKCVNLIKLLTPRNIWISVMDYSPVTLYSKKPIFWPAYDNAIRAAAVCPLRFVTNNQGKRCASKSTF